MVRKTEERRDTHQKTDVYNVWAENYTGFLRLWGDSHLKLYKPWVESMSEMSEKAVLISQDAVPERYKEFYDEWMRTYQHTFGKFYPLPAQNSSKETLEKLLESAEESNRLYRSWIAELEENSKKTLEIMRGNPDHAKYKECYDIWMRSYEKMLDDLHALPAVEQTKEMLTETGVPDIFSGTHTQMAKLWKDSYSRIYKPWIESMFRLSEKAAEISKGKASAGDYKEFYNLWMDTYQENFSRLLDGSSAKSSKEAFENFLQNASIYLNMYKSWISALEKVSEKSKELSSLTASPEAYKEFCDLWIKMYEKAFDSFFDDMPMIGPMKETMEPVKIAARAYTDAYIKMSRAWAKSSFNAASRT